MKISKCLIFKANQQKFAIKTKNVVNVVERVKLTHQKMGNTIAKSTFNFNGLTIPFINFHSMLGTNRYLNNMAECVLIVEINNNGYHEIVGLSVDEIIEVTELEDLMSYPYMPVLDKRPSDFREAIIKHRDESIVVLNTNKLWSKHMSHFEEVKTLVSVN
jgi:chemotaxis signal transduction protein